MTKENEVKLKKRTTEEMSLYYADKVAENRKEIEELQKRLEEKERKLNKAIDKLQKLSMYCIDESVQKEIEDFLEDFLKEVKG
jgi:HD superfamily phosphohydrolase YqeK